MLTECEVNGKEGSSPSRTPPPPESLPIKDEPIEETESLTALRTQYEAEVNRVSTQNPQLNDLILS